MALEMTGTLVPTLMTAWVWLDTSSCGLDTTLIAPFPARAWM